MVIASYPPGSPDAALQSLAGTLSAAWWITLALFQVAKWGDRLATRVPRLAPRAVGAVLLALGISLLGVSVGFDTLTPVGQEVVSEARWLGIAGTLIASFRLHSLRPPSHRLRRPALLLVEIDIGWLAYFIAFTAGASSQAAGFGMLFLLALTVVPANIVLVVRMVVLQVTGSRRDCRNCFAFVPEERSHCPECGAAWEARIRHVP